MRFHTDLRDAEASRPAEPGRHPRHRGHHPADRHPARLADGRIELLDTYQGQDLAGDATVPIVAPAGPMSRWTATRCAASRTSTATCTATRPPWTRSKAS